jgi:hypothetical protein
MVEKVNVEKQKTPMIPYIERVLEESDYSGCIDGRPGNENRGAKMLGGAVDPVFMFALWTGQDFNEEFVISSIKTLLEKKIRPGVHRGSHAHKNHEHPEESTSDCGFADKLKTIFKTTLEKQPEITEILEPYCQKEALDNVFNKLKEYDIEKIKLTGEALISTIEKVVQQQDKEYAAEVLQGEHKEKKAFVNTEKYVTFDTNEADRQEKQAFNLDLEAAVEQAKILGVDENFARTANLIFYVATEMVLVEQKGKPALEVTLNK